MQDFTNETIDLDKLPKYQEIVLTAPDQKYWKVIIINICIFLFIIGIGLGLFLWLNTYIKPYTYPIIGGFLVFGILLFLIHRASFKKRGYALREKDIVYKSGIIAEKTSIVPLNRIQHVSLDEGVFSRMYGLATLEIHTAGGSAGHMHIAGIPVEKASVIKEALLKRIDLLESLAAD
ncbi:PH domain-containing protein [Pedobacter sp. UC225_65]|uniref:PH domain-containing protein n=1 Tax=Pedobacter sp. UC225_65 TaxID=3350173 RepID=UPI003670FB54